MIGIYKIVNKENNKTYVGQSNNIERRFSEHKTKTDIFIDKEIRKLGSNNFSFEILEECTLEELNEREKFWIRELNTYKGFGYNMSVGGLGSVGEENNNSKLTEEEVIEIRKAYNSHQKRKEIYKRYSDKISFHSFASIWDGKTWTHIMPEVYTEENLNYYKRETSLGENSAKAILSDEEVLKCRERYVKETAREIYQDYKDRIKFQTFQQLLWGRHYKHLPIYKKSLKKWINL